MSSDDVGQAQMRCDADLQNFEPIWLNRITPERWIARSKIAKSAAPRACHARASKASQTLRSLQGSSYALQTPLENVPRFPR
eukprot:4200967-Pyramimonas_sp.AAC.1